MRREGSVLREQIERFAVLVDPVRRSLYLLARERQPRALTRDDAAAAVQIGRSLAAFHLDRLVAAGLLTADYKRISGRKGPGAGRPAKLYRPSSLSVELSIPPKQHRLASTIMSRALRAPSSHIAGRLEASAFEEGRSMGRRAAQASATRRKTGRELAAVIGLLRATGYEPVVSTDGSIRLQTCPFDVADVVPAGYSFCRLNQQLIAGMLTGAGSGRHAQEGPAFEGSCCVQVSP